MTVAVDAMGGDRAPAAIVEGSVRATALQGCPGIVLVGHRPTLDELLDGAVDASRAGGVEPNPDLITLVHADQAVEMDESPTAALRRKPDSSIAKCIALAAAGEASAIVSAGNTGALVASSLRSLPLPSVRRPGIAVTLPSMRNGTTVIDVGANVHCKPSHLFDYGIMATEFARCFLGIPKPTIGLLNIGEEDEKGNELVRRTMELFRESDLAFIGNVEGQDVFNGRCDIVVCEGFVGNVILKVSEGFAETTLSWLSDAVAAKSADDRERAVWSDALSVFRAHTDYSNYGGAILLGVATTCVICHGRSEASAITNAIRSADRFVRAGVHEHVRQGLEARRASRPRDAAGEILERS